MPKRVRFALPRLVSLFAVLVGGAGLAAAPMPAAAYGTEHLFEVTLSYNCQNMTICPSTPFGIGGIWGWLEPDAGGTADGHVTFQGHQNANPALNGVGHSLGFLGYATISCPSPNPLCGVVALEEPPTDPNGNYFIFFGVFQSGGFQFQLPVATPATPGHYSQHFAPGVDVTATVTQL